MRTLAILFGLLGAVGSGFFGVKWLADLYEQRDQIEQMRKQAEATRDPKLIAAVENVDHVRHAAYALFGATALSPVALLLIHDRRRLLASALFLTIFVVPLVFKIDVVPCCTFGSGLAAVFSFFAAVFASLGLPDDVSGGTAPEPSTRADDPVQ